MIYLDYAANTPVREEVLETFLEVSRSYIANPNSPHRLGQLAKARLDESIRSIQLLLHAPAHEVICTSGASESNNLAIKGVAKKYRSFGKHIITTFLEHSSVNGAMQSLLGDGFEVDYVDITSDGQVDMCHLAELLRPDTILVSVCAVDSEIGLTQPVDAIGKLLAGRPNCFFHVDGTQATGKIPVSLQNIDLFTFAPHKFYGLNGCSALLKKQPVLLEPLIHGGISTTPYRSGTPDLAQIAAMERALHLAMQEMDGNLKHAAALNNYLRDALALYPSIKINSTARSTPYILNISIPDINTRTLQQELEKHDIFLSTKSACCAPNSVSRPVYALTNDRKRALSTLRISVGRQTTMEDIKTFLSCFDTCLQMNKK